MPEGVGHSAVGSDEAAIARRRLETYEPNLLSVKTVLSGAVNAFDEVNSVKSEFARWNGKTPQATKMQVADAIEQLYPLLDQISLEMHKLLNRARELQLPLGGDLIASCYTVLSGSAAVTERMRKAEQFIQEAISDPAVEEQVEKEFHELMNRACATS